MILLLLNILYNQGERSNQMKLPVCQSKSTVCQSGSTLCQSGSIVCQSGTTSNQQRRPMFGVPVSPGRSTPAPPTRIGGARSTPEPPARPHPPPPPNIPLATVSYFPYPQAGLTKSNINLSL